jgi:hypothetical protein
VIHGIFANVVTGNVFDVQANIRCVNSTVTDNLFLAGFDDPSGGSDAKAVTWQRNFFRNPTINQVTRRADWSESYFVADGSTYSGNGTYSATANLANPHWTTPVGATDTYAVTNCIFESFGSDGTGDIDYRPNTASRSLSFTYNIILPDQVADSNGQLNAGTLVTNNGFSGEASVYEHNTFYSGGQGPLAIAEGGNGFLRMKTSVRSNLCWNDSRHLGNTFNYFAYLPTNPAGIVQDTIDPTKCDYNGGWNINSTLPAGMHGVNVNTKGHYAIPLSATVGTHDVYANPGFVDSTRNLSTWVASLEPTWVAAPSGAFPANNSPSRTDYNAHGLYKLSLINQTTHVDYDNRYTLAALKTYIRAGFAVTNTALVGAAHDATIIGAVQIATYSETGSGGTLGGGTAIYSVTIRPTITSAGALGGSSAPVSAVYSMTASGGALGDSSAVISAIYLPTASGGGLNGTAGVINAKYIIVASGGELGDGTAPNSLSGAPTFDETGSGGSFLGGAGIVTVVKLRSDNPLPAIYYCRPLGRYVAAFYLGAGSDIKTRRFNRSRGSVALVPAITVCNQKLLQFL